MEFVCQIPTKIETMYVPKFIKILLVEIFLVQHI